MESKDRVIAELRELVAKLIAQLERQAERIAELELALAKANKDSSTSSKPPRAILSASQEGPGSRKKRKQGGQPGHGRKLRDPLPPERVDQTFEYEIDAQEVKDCQLRRADVDRHRHVWQAGPQFLRLSARIDFG